MENVEGLVDDDNRDGFGGDNDDSDYKIEESNLLYM